MKFVITTLLLFVSAILFAQKRDGLSDRALQLQVGNSKHGTGDLRGVSFNVTYKEYFRPHLYWNAGIGASIHNGQDDLFYTDTYIEKNIDGSVRYTTGGMQAFGGIGFSPVRTEHSELEVRLNALIRYQSSSIYDVISIISPAATSYPYPLVEFQNTTPARTVSVGAFLQLGYNYSITPKVYLGVGGTFQSDTEGDVIADYSFTIGRRF